MRLGQAMVTIVTIVTTPTQLSSISNVLCIYITFLSAESIWINIPWYKL